jgi:putative endonuclease
MPDSRMKLGAKGEKRAAKFLKRKGYKIIQRNYKCKSGEIDIIARHNDSIVFVEVKTRSTDEFGAPQYAITSAKRNHLSKVALYYIKEKRLINQSCRFDVVAVKFSQRSRKPEIEHIENAFELSRRYTY